jgi:hypothetical protein
MNNLTGAERRVLETIVHAGRRPQGKPLTAAELKRAMPGAVPVATIRNVCDRLISAGFVRTVMTTTHRGIVPTYQATDAGREIFEGVAL